MMVTERNFIQENLKAYKVYKFLEKELDRAGFSRVEIQQTPIVTRIIVYATNPGKVIGKKGMSINELTEEIKKNFGIKNPQISVEEVKEPRLEPRIVAKNIVRALEMGKNAKRVIYSALREIIEAGALGAEIVAAGKLAAKGARAKKIRISAGYIPKAGEPAKLPRIASYTAYPKYGAIGVTVKILLPGTKIPGKEEIKPIVLPKVIKESKEEVSKEAENKEEKHLKMRILIVGAVIRNKADKSKILLVQQAKGHTHEGMWGVPGGKVKEKESLEEALKREIREETNLDISVVRPLHIIKLEKENVVIYCYECEYQEEKIKPGSDIAKAAWVSLEEMEKYKLRPGMHELKEFLLRSSHP